MSLDTYLSILMTTLFSLVITIIVAIIQTKKNKDGKKQIRKFQYLIGLIILIALVLTIVFCISSHVQKRAEYTQQIDAGNFDLHNHEYLDAAEHYHQANLLSYNQNTSLQSTYYEGMCHLLLAITSNNYEHCRYAAQIYTYIINNQKNSNSEYYIDAIADMSYIHFLLGDSWNNPEWVSLIELLEKETLFESPEKQLSSTELSLQLKISLALGMYYGQATYATFDNLINPDLSSKALIYFTQFTSLYTLSAEKSGSITAPKFQTATILAISDFLFTYGITSEDPDKYFNTAVELCTTELSKISDSKHSFNDYLCLKENIGKGYFFLSYIHDDKEADYLQNAYKTLSPLIYINDPETTTALVDIGYYLVRTNLCTEKEIARVIEIYEEDLAQTPITDDPSERAITLISACNACKWIVENYDSALASEAGFSYSEELYHQLFDFLDDDNKKEAEGFYSFFEAAYNKNQLIATAKQKISNNEQPG